MAPKTKAEIRATFRTRIASARTAKGWDEAKLAEEAGLQTITVKRWEREAGTSPYLADARKAANALDVTLDWLTGREITPAETVASVVARADEEVKAMHARLDQLLSDLMEARSALVRDGADPARKLDALVPKEGSGEQVS
jgi:transcriptional regulator with XRE-family HTH domain